MWADLQLFIGWKVTYAHRTVWNMFIGHLKEYPAFPYEHKASHNLKDVAQHYGANSVFSDPQTLSNFCAGCGWHIYCSTLVCPCWTMLKVCPLHLHSGMYMNFPLFFWVNARRSDGNMYQYIRLKEHLADQKNSKRTIADQMVNVM